MVSMSSFRRHRRDSSKGPSTDGRLPFFSLFSARADKTDKLRSTSTSFSERCSVESDTGPSSTDSDLDGGALSLSTSSISVSTPEPRERSRSSSSSSVFSRFCRRFPESPPGQISRKQPKRSFEFSRLFRSTTETETIRKSSTSSDNFVNNENQLCEGDTVIGNKPQSPFVSRSPWFAADHFRLSSISENSKEHQSPNILPIMDEIRLRPGTLLRPGSLLADQREKARRRKDAQDMYQTIVRNAERSKTTVPPYEFLELIGKGAFGRVYKCRDPKTGDLVAIKIADIDENDFSSSWEEQNVAIRDFQKEVSILQQLKDSKARNVNIIHEAFDLHSQLWIVADYCTGGSIRTLLYPTAPNGLEELFIIPIARELAIALRDVHNIDIIHRDVKCANVYITENGDIQLGDFGIVGLIEDGQSKRKTVIGTPHFMPIEMVAGMNTTGGTEQAYGTEVDVWSYGITIYEMATGQPPNTRVQPHALAQVLQERPPRLEGDVYSEELRDFVAFCLQTDPKARPTMDAILNHPYISNTEKKYPTSNLVKLVERFKVWEHGGGSRNSLWSAGGLPPPMFDDIEETSPLPEDDQGWNFSTSDDFDQEFGQRLSHMFGSLDPVSQDQGITAAAISEIPGEQVLSPAERIRREHADKAANRGQQYLGKLFAGPEPYGMHIQPVEEPVPPPSDLPLRTYTDQGEEDLSEQVIDLDEANAQMNVTAPILRLSLNDGDTIRASASQFHQEEDDEQQSFYEHGADDKRDTMAWTFPGTDPVSEKRDTIAWTFPGSDSTSEKRDTMAWTFPEPELDAEAEKRDTMAWKFPNSDPPPEKRDTMAWTFDTAEPMEPDDPDVTMKLPSAGADGQLPYGYRPRLKHTATEPIGRLEHLLYDHTPRAAAGNNRLSTETIDLDAALPIDLDAAIPVDPGEMQRPSTASSAAGSATTDATSGNPFDLEEDPMQNEVDRNRFSYHKQWQSEGGRMKRSSYKSMQMHARGSSLSSTDSELERAGPKFDEILEGDLGHRGSHPQPHHSLQLGLGDDFSRTEWPNFGDFDQYSTHDTLSRVQDLNYPPEARPRANGSVASLSGLHEPLYGFPGQVAVEMPEPEVPMPVALVEDANPQLLANEFSKQMAHLEGSLVGMIQALRSYANLDDEESEHDAHMNGDSGFDSTRDTSEDEDNGYNGGTMRNDRRHRVEPRATSPQLPVSGLP